MPDRTVLYTGAAFSAVLIFAFVMLQKTMPEALALPAHWLAVAALPVLVALFVGGYITRFKGFGIELEATLKANVDTLDLTAGDAVADVPGDEKRSIMYLEQTPPEKRRAIRRLLFVSGRKDYYSAYAIGRYLQMAPNCEFLEVRTEAGDIEGFLPVRAVVTPEGDPDDPAIHRFIEAVEKATLKTTFPQAAVTLRVQATDNLVQVLQKLRSERADFAAVISPQGRYLGVALAQEVERRIADSVLTAKQAQG